MPANIKPGTFLFLCQSCGARLAAKEANRGKKIKCPKCQKVTLCKPPSAKSKQSVPAVPAATAPTKVKKDTTPAPAKNRVPVKSSANVKPSPPPKKPKAPSPPPPSAPPPEPLEDAAPSFKNDTWNAPPPKPKPAAAKPTPSRRSKKNDGEGMSSMVIWGSVFIFLFLLGAGSYYVYSAFLSAPTVGTLSGKVVHDDKALPFGNVILNPKTGVPPIICPIQPDGSYQAKEVPYGELIICVVQLNPEWKSGAALRKEAKGKLENVATLTNAKQHLLPEIYADTMTSPLRFTLNKSADKFDINLPK